MNIEEMADSFKNLAELQDFSVKQQKMIMEFQKKVKLLEEENAHLKLLVEANTSLLISQGESPLVMSDEESIARLQLKKIKESALARELSLDEARRVEIYTKILHGYKVKKPDGKEKEIRSLDDQVLLQQLENV